MQAVVRAADGNPRRTRGTGRGRAACGGIAVLTDLSRTSVPDRRKGCMSTVRGQDADAYRRFHASQQQKSRAAAAHIAHGAPSPLGTGYAPRTGAEREDPVKPSGRLQGRLSNGSQVGQEGLHCG